MNLWNFLKMKLIILLLEKYVNFKIQQKFVLLKNIEVNYLFLTIILIQLN